MLNLESRMEILGITVFRDLDRLSQFYYLPGPPHISQERGSPLFDLFSYRKGGEAGTTMAGGFLNMAVDLDIGSLKGRVEARLRDQFGDDVNLAAVPFSKGAARVIALGEDSKALQGGVENERTPGGSPVVTAGPRFIENILSSNTPSLDKDNRVIFSFSLTEDGAAFFLGALQGNITARPVGVIYDLEYIGLLPAYDLEITINFKQAYDYMRTRFTLGTLFFRADIDNIVEQLKRNESIKIRETARTLELSTPEAVQQRQARIDQLVKDLASGAMFQPSLVPGEPKVAGDTITAADPTTTAPTSGPLTAMAALRHGPAAALVAGMGEVMIPQTDRAGASATNQPSGAGGNQPSGAGGASNTGSAAGGATQPSSGTTAADVWNRLGRPQAAFALRRISQEEERTVTYNLSQVSAQKQNVSPQNFIQFMATPAELRRRIHVVDLNHPFFKRVEINVTAGDVDFAGEGVKQMTVELRYGKKPDGTWKDTAAAILRTAADSKDFVFFTDATQTQHYEYRLIVDFRNDFGIGVNDLHVEGSWTQSELRSLVVHPRWVGQHVLKATVRLAPNVPDDVSSVEARVRYVNQARNVDSSKLVTLTKADPSEIVPIRLADAAETFEVSSTLFFTDGNREDLPPVRLPDASSGASDDTAVIGVPPASLLSGDIIMQDPMGELQAVVVDTRVFQGASLVQSRSTEIQQAGRFNTFSARLPDRTQPARLEYRERRLFKDGGQETDVFRTAVETNLVVGVPAANVMTVSVRYLGPSITQLGLDGILLDLEYKAPDGNPQFEQSKSLLMTSDASSHAQEWKVRLPVRQATTYRWRMKLFFTTGLETSTEFQPDTRSILTIRPPRL